MAKAPQLSIQALKALRALYLSLVPLAGADLMRATHISSGTMYPLLVRLEAAQIIESAWETASPQQLHRPRMGNNILDREVLWRRLAQWLISGGSPWQ